MPCSCFALLKFFFLFFFAYCWWRHSSSYCAMKDSVDYGGEDVNRMLLATTTASADAVEASERWVTRQKKRGGGASATSAASHATHKKARVDSCAGVSTSADTRALVNDVVDAAAASVGTCASSGDNMPEVLVQRLMEYVMTRELGGRHNAFHGDGAEAAAPPRAVLFAETATICPTAFYQIYHLVYGGTSMTQSERVVEAIARHRKRQHVCNYERDLVGGFVDGNPLHRRQHMLALVVGGLKGECFDASLGSDHVSTAKVETTESKRDHAVVLFEGVQKKVLSDFLRSSSNSSSNADEED